MHGGGPETVAPDLGDEYVARFGLRDLVEAWMDRVAHELPSDPYQILMDEAETQRQLSGGVVTCPNAWCGMPMPGYVYAIHSTLCIAQQHWTRCVRCNERIEAALLSTHLMTCRAEPCRFCGGLSLPRMMPLCPIQQLFEADRATNALRYRRHRKQALALEEARTSHESYTSADAPAHIARLANYVEDAANAMACTNTATASATLPISTTLAATEVVDTDPITSPPFLSPDDSLSSLPSGDMGAMARARAPHAKDGETADAKKDIPTPSTPREIPLLIGAQKEYLMCLQRLWRRGMVSERYRVMMLSKVWEDLDMYEERMGVSQSLDGGGFLEGIVESLNSSLREDAGAEDLDEALSRSYSHAVSSNISSYGDEDNDELDKLPERRTHSDGVRDGLREAEVIMLDAESEDGDEHANRRAKAVDGMSSVGTNDDLEQRSFQGIIRKGSLALVAPDAVVTASSAHGASHHPKGGADNLDEDDEDVEDDEDDDDDVIATAASTLRARHSRILSLQQSTVAHISSLSPPRRSKRKRRPQQLWLHVSTTPDVNGAFMSEESMWAITRLSGHREVFRASLVVAVVRAATRILLERPVVQRVTTPPRGVLVVVGDLHGQMKDLLHLLRVTGGPSPTRYFVFNGDLVDRGPYGCEVLVHVFALLCTYPRYVYINRGNHEDRRTNQEYGFLAELFGKYGSKSAHIHKILEASYTAMPLMTIVDQRYCIVHGGVPRDDCTLEEIENIGRVRDVPVVEQKTRQDRLLVDLLWNDPVEKYQSRQIGDRHQGNGWRSSKRGCGAEYLLQVTSRFLKRNGLSIVIRSHDVKPGGFEMVHNNQCVTVFSASNYAGVSGNRGAVAILQSESKYPTYQTWLLQKDTAIRKRASAAGLDEADAVAFRNNGYSDEYNNATENELMGAEDLLEEDPRAVRDEFVRSFYGENALIELVRAYVDFVTRQSGKSSSPGSNHGGTVSTLASSASRPGRTDATESKASAATPNVCDVGSAGDGDAHSLVSSVVATFRLSNFMSEPTILQQLKTIRILRDMIYLNRYSLLVAFNGADEMRTGVVYKVEWCVAMREVTDLDVPWYYLCQFLAPRLVLDGIPAVEYVRFLRHYDAPFGRDYRPEWQRSMVRRSFSDLDLPEDILRAFRVYDNSGGNNTTAAPSTAASSLSSVRAKVAPATTTATIDADESMVTAGGDAELFAVPRAVAMANGAAGAAAALADSYSPSTSQSMSWPRHERLRSTMSTTSVPSSSGAGRRSPPFRSPSGRAPHAVSSNVSSIAAEDVDISVIAIDFITFASRLRSISPVVATLEDTDLYCLFRFFDVEMRGHVYLDDFIRQVNEVLNDGDDDSGDSSAEVILSCEDIDFGSVSMRDNVHRQPRSSSSSSPSSSTSSSKHRGLSKKGGGRGGGLLPRTASNVISLRRTGAPAAASMEADTTQASPLAAPSRMHVNTAARTSDDSNADSDAKESRDRFFESTDTRPFDSVSTRCVLPAPVVQAASVGDSGLRLSDGDGDNNNHSSIEDGQDDASKKEHRSHGDDTGDGGRPHQFSREAVRELAANTPVPAPPSQVISAITTYEALSAVPPNPICEEKHQDERRTEDDGSPLEGGPCDVNEAPRRTSTVLIELHNDSDLDADEPMMVPSGKIVSSASSLPAWIGSTGAVPTGAAQSSAWDLSSAKTTAEALAIMRSTQRERAAKMPWLYPTLLRVQEQLMHRGSEERTYRVFRALNRKRDGKLTQKEFWSLIRFSNTRLDRPVTEAQSNIIFQCIHDDNLLRVHTFCTQILKQLDEREGLAETLRNTTASDAAGAARQARGNGEATPLSCLHRRSLSSSAASSESTTVPGSAHTARAREGAASSAAIDDNSILMARLRDEREHGHVYVTALEFVSYFSVVAAVDMTASSPSNTDTNTVVGEELLEQLRALQTQPSNSESLLDPVMPGSVGLGRFSKVSIAPTAVSGAAGAVTLHSPRSVDVDLPLSHISTAGEESASTPGRYRHHSNSGNTNPRASGVVNKSFSSRSLSVVVPAHLARLSAVSNISSGAAGGSMSSTGARQLIADTAMSTNLDYLANLFPPETTLAEMTAALRAYKSFSAVAGGDAGGASGFSPNHSVTHNGHNSALPATAVRPAAPYNSRRSVRSFAVAPSASHMPVMSLNSQGVLSADALGDSVQTPSIRSNATTSILSIPMQLQPAEHRITTNALFGTGGFGQSGMVPLGRTPSSTGASLASSLLQGTMGSLTPRVSTASMAPPPTSPSFCDDPSRAAATVPAATARASQKNNTRLSRFNVTVPAPPPQGRARRAVDTQGTTSSSRSATGTATAPSSAPPYAGVATTPRTDKSGPHKGPSPRSKLVANTNMPTSATMKAPATTTITATATMTNTLKPAGALLLTDTRNNRSDDAASLNAPASTGDGVVADDSALIASPRVAAAPVAPAAATVIKARTVSAPPPSLPIVSKPTHPVPDAPRRSAEGRPRRARGASSLVPSGTTTSTTKATRSSTKPSTLFSTKGSAATACSTAREPIPEPASRPPQVYDETRPTAPTTKDDTAASALPSPEPPGFLNHTSGPGVLSSTTSTLATASPLETVAPPRIKTSPSPPPTLPNQTASPRQPRSLANRAVSSGVAPRRASQHRMPSGARRAADANARAEEDKDVGETAAPCTSVVADGAPPLFLKSASRPSRSVELLAAQSATEGVAEPPFDRSNYAQTAASTPSCEALALTRATAPNSVVSGQRGGPRTLHARGAAPVAAVPAKRTAKHLRTRSRRGSKSSARHGEEVTAERLPSLTTAVDAPSTSTCRERRVSTRSRGSDASSSQGGARTRRPHHRNETPAHGNGHVSTNVSRKGGAKR